MMRENTSLYWAIISQLVLANLEGGKRTLDRVRATNDQNKAIKNFVYGA